MRSDINNNLKNIHMGKNKREAYDKRQEEKANNVIKGIFISLIVLALVMMVVFAINA